MNSSATTPAKPSRPSLKVTLAFVVATIVVFAVFLNNPAVKTETGFSALGIALILVANICFWGMLYRVSKHLQVTLGSSPGSRFLRILILAVLVIGFFFGFTLVNSGPKTPEAAPSPGDYIQELKDIQESK